MRKVRITYIVPDKYEDVHVALIVADMKVSDYWVITEVEDLCKN